MRREGRGLLRLLVLRGDTATAAGGRREVLTPLLQNRRKWSDPARRLLAVALASLVLGACGDRSAPEHLLVHVAGNEATFLVAADTHLGAKGMKEKNQRQIDAMNALPGTPWPKALGGQVAKPAAVIVAGDLTDRGRYEEWIEFARLYGSAHDQGRLAYPALVGTGNHDRPMLLLSPVVHAVLNRHGRLDYTVHLGGLHVIGLDVYPDATALPWLRQELTRIGTKEPVLIWFHYPLTGPYSDWWTEEEKAAFRKTVDGYRVVAIFHGHYHRSGHYVWNGLQVYNVGSPRHSDHSFACVRWKNERLDVAAWDWQRGRWAWHHRTSVPRP